MNSEQIEMNQEICDAIKNISERHNCMVTALEFDWSVALTGIKDSRIVSAKIETKTFFSSN